MGHLFSSDDLLFEERYLPSLLPRKKIVIWMTMKSLAARVKEFHANRSQPTRSLKYKLMAGNEFTFYRGTCHLYYEDMARNASLPDAPLAWCSGDLHLENFGSYRASNGLVYFDINDFDEGALAPASWELVRFLGSIGMAADVWNYSAREAEDLMMVALKAYAAQLAEGKAYAIEKETSPPLIKDFFEMAEKQREKEQLKERVDLKKETLKIIKQKTLPLSAELYQEIKSAVGTYLKETYGFFKIKDIAFRIAGTGSLGMKRYVVLVEDKRQEKLRLLDVKQALPSSLAPHVPTLQPSFTSEAERVVTIQTLMQYAKPRFMGTLSIGADAFILKQMQPSAQKIDHTLCDKKMKNLETVITTMAQAVASAQLRSASRKGAADVDTLIDFSQQTSWKVSLMDCALQSVITMKNHFKEYKESYEAGELES
jgi:uncharacterized protein (DUF2252 family)